MKILETRGAPNPRRVRMFLAEKGIAMTFEEVDIQKGGARSPEFTAQNPWQRVPVLILDDGTAVSETVAICRYFEELQPEPALFGRGALGRATVEMWQRRVELGLFFHIAQVLRHLNPKMGHLEVPQVREWGEANRPKVLEALAMLDRRLGESRYVAGAEFSIADITALVAVDFMRAPRIERPATLTHVERWHREVSARPSAQA